MAKDQFTKSWITENSIEICSRYEHGVLTLRSLYYQLVSLGMTNSLQHYSRVVSAMGDARWEGLIDFEQFSDLDRSMVGETEYEETVLEDEIERAKESIQMWMTSYWKNRWENQLIYPEVLIEKKALQGIFGPICKRLGVSLGACKGYPSLTFLHDMAERLKTVNDKEVVILYFGDYDPSGEDIPRSIVANLAKFGVEVDLRRIALMEHQVRAWHLPPAPAKATDSRTAAWEGIGQVELDAVKPEQLQEMCTNAINELFDEELYDELREQEREERREYKMSLREYVNSLNDE